MTPITIHNTLSGKKEQFKPIKKGRLAMYNCGPTVYDFAHIGNLRTYVFSDILRRTFEYEGYKVRQVMNITDVGHLSSDADDGEDKMTRALKRENKPMTLEAMRDVGTHYFGKFVEDLKALNIELPQYFPRASDHIKEDIKLIKKLDKKGFVYKTSDGMYFDTAKFPSYGKLGNIDIKGLREGARVAVNSEKKNPTDFSVWKFDKNIGWESPWGKGFPGWHIECSAMSREYLGQPFDIHTGGIDHIPVHHNNEIAQSEAAYDKPLAHYWLHGAFMTIDNSKMAKSDGNFITLNSLHDQYISPIGYRYWLLTSHYRSQINFSFEAVIAAQTALFKLCEEIVRWGEDEKLDKKTAKSNEKYKNEFEAAITDDFNMPQAVAIMWKVAKDASLSPAEKKATVLDFDRVFGLRLAEVSTISNSSILEKTEIPPEITALAEARLAARTAQDWPKADALRAEIESRGFTVKDIDKSFSIEEL